jgi:transposase
MAPGLVEAEYGLGVLTAAQILLSWSHAGRIRSEAAFAMLSGTAPVPVSSGRTDRHRLNRLGDRQLNRALHIIAINRMRSHPPTQAYVQRRLTEGKTERDIRRCISATSPATSTEPSTGNSTRHPNRIDKHRSVNW